MEILMEWALENKMSTLLEWSEENDEDSDEISDEEMDSIFHQKIKEYEEYEGTTLSDSQKLVILKTIIWK